MPRKDLFVPLFVLFVTVSGVVIVDAQEPRFGPRSPLATAGTAFTYQGQLKNGGSVVNGTCDFQFGLWDSSSGGLQVSGTFTHTVTGVTVTNGLFTALVDFRVNAFNGDARYLGIAVACPPGSYTPMSSRQALTPAPYSQYALGNLNRNAADTSAASIPNGGVMYDFTQTNSSTASSSRSVLRLNDNTTTPGSNDFLITARNNGTTKFSVKTNGDVGVAGAIAFSDNSKQVTAASKVLGYAIGEIRSYITSTEQVVATLTVTTGSDVFYEFSADYIINSCYGESVAPNVYLSLYVDSNFVDRVGAFHTFPLVSCSSNGSNLTQFGMASLIPTTHTFQIRVSSSLTDSVGSNAYVGWGRLAIINK